MKNESFPETLYDRLDLDPSVSSEFAKQESEKFSAKTTIPEQKGIYTEIGRLMNDPARRLAYDALKVTTIHETCQKPGTTHHLPGMHQVIKQVIPDGVLQRYPDIWSRAPKAKDVTHKLKVNRTQYFHTNSLKYFSIVLLGRVLQWQKNQTQNCTSSALLNVQWVGNLSSTRKSNEWNPLSDMPRKEN